MFMYAYLYVYIKLQEFCNLKSKLHKYLYKMYLVIEDACGLKVIINGNGYGKLSSNSGQGISHRPNTLGKGMNPTIPCPAMSK